MKNAEHLAVDGAVTGERERLDLDDDVLPRLDEADVLVLDQRLDLDRSALGTMVISD